MTTSVEGNRVTRLEDRALEMLHILKASPFGSHMALSLKVDTSRRWQEAVIGAGPDTHMDWPVVTAEADFPFDETATQDRKIVLVNFGRAVMRVETLLEAMKGLGLNPVHPRTLWQIGEEIPGLDKTLQRGLLQIVTLMKSKKDQAAVLWWREEERGTHLRKFCGPYYDSYWFALELA